MGEYMLKKIVSSSLIVIFCGVWIYLDHLNKLQIKEAQEMRIAMEQARLQALARAKAAAETKAKFEATIMADLTACKATAEKAKEDFLLQNQKPVRRKPGQFTVSPAVTEEAAKNLETANAACQATYDNRMRTGL
jgi:hypothetical protein